MLLDGNEANCGEASPLAMLGRGREGGEGGEEARELGGKARGRERRGER